MRHRHPRRTDARLRRQIATEGVAIVPGSIRRPGRRFDTHYTVGLTRHEGHPELIVVDLCCECAAMILSSIAEVVRAGTRLDAGWGVQVEGFPYVLLEVEDPRALRWAQRVYRTSDRWIPALQVVGADSHGEFPWESGIGIDAMLGPAPRVLPAGW